MAIAWSPTPAEAREGERQQIDISASTLRDALAELSREAGVSVGTDGTLPHRRTPAVKGRMDVGEALARLLQGSGYVARQVGPTAWRIERVPQRAAAPPAPALRVEAPPPPVEAVPILVTASKRGTGLLDLPMAASVVQPADTAAAGAGPSSGTASIASEIEGLTLTALGSGRNRMFLRGIADSPFNGESQSTVAVVFDDARVTYAAPDPDISLVDIDRVEVLKGPQGALYGTGALGGIYHVVSRRADLDDTTLDLSAAGEVTAKGSVGYAASAVANLPLAEGSVGLRLVGYSRLQPGWVDTGEKLNSNANHMFGARAGLGADPGGGWRLDLTGFMQLAESRDSQYVYEPGARQRPAQIGEPHDNDLRHVSARLAREGADGIDIVLSSGLTWHEVDDTLDATIGADSFGLAHPQTLEVARNYRVWDSEARISGRMGSWSWLVGLSAVQASQHDLWSLSASSDALVIDDDRRDSTDLAAFGDLTVPLGSGLALDAGARLFHSTVTEARVLPSGLASEDLSRTGLTPSLALSWRPGGGQLAFLRYGSAIRQGGLDISSSGELERLKGDELMTLEAGWRQRLGGRGRLELGAYYTVWEDMQSDMLLPNGLIETRNAGKAEIRGLEGSLFLPFGAEWELSLGGTVQDARLVRNDLGIELEDARLPVIPDYVLRGALARSFTLGKAEGMVRFRLRYSGPSRLSFDPALDRPMGKVLESGLETRLDFGRFDLTLALDNLFQGHADEFAFGNPLRFATMRQYTPQRPFTATLAVHAGF